MKANGNLNHPISTTDSHESCITQKLHNVVRVSRKYTHLHAREILLEFGGFITHRDEGQLGAPKKCDRPTRELLKSATLKLDLFFFYSNTT